jgi:Leucine-rich repeat (LRR) protein
MELLLGMGVNINAFVKPLHMGSDPKYTALGIAGVEGQYEVVEFLLNHGAKDPENKALRRTLRVGESPQLKCAGLMLWHNEYASILPAHKDPEVPIYQGRKPDISVMLAWGQRELKQLCTSWLSLHSPQRIQEGKLASITSIELTSNFLTELPIDLFKLPYLTRLDVSKNKIAFLPTQGELGWECRGLFELKVSYNEIRSLPEGIFEMPNLTDVDASHNNIASLPVAMWHAPKLKTFKLNHNRIVQLPFPNPLESFATGTGRMTMSSTSDNQSDDSPTTPKRATLSFGDSLSRSYFKKPQRHTRKKVDLVQSKEGFNKRYGFLNSSEGIETEERIAEAELISPLDDPGSVSCLETLSLQNNQLTMVPRGICCLAPKLHRLTISHNQISSLGHINDFPIDLDTLDAQHNEIEEGILPSLASHEKWYMNVSGLPVSFCPRLYLLEGDKAPLFLNRACCGHRNHRQLRKLSSYRLSHNKLESVELFTESSRRPHSLSDPASEGRSTRDTQQTGRSSSGGRKSVQETKPKTQTKRSSSSGNASSVEDEGQEDSLDVITVPLFPGLNTLEVASNSLSSLPKHIHLVTSLGSLDISNNKEITSLPLEMGHLENLFFFMYNNVPLRSPNPADLQNCKDTPSKMFYLRTLLQDAQPNTSLKLMLVGFQKQGKTTLLSNLTDVNEINNTATTFTMRTTDDFQQKPVKQGTYVHTYIHHECVCVKIVLGDPGV